MKRPEVLSNGAIGLTAFLVALWAAAAALQWISPVFLPSPAATWQALIEGFSRGDLLMLTAGTVERMVYGWVLASLAGIALGALIGSSRVLREWLAPMLELMRPLPASALVPVVIAFVGLSPAMVLIVVVFGSIWPVMLATVHGVASVEPRLHEVSRVLGLSRVEHLWKIGLPNALPDALAGMRIALTVALILAVVGEMLASQQGLGTAILLAARSFRSAELFAGVVLLGGIGLASNALLSAAEHRALRWKHTH
jgi:ABC-type nitrate/sulfonate/bicarbonate transport system permease component